MKLTTKLFLAFLLLLLGIAYAQNARPSAPQATQVPMGNLGRYQIVVDPGGPNNFLLDTQTGKTWQWTRFSDLENEPKAWTAQLRFDSTQELP
jgi:hypothetical protein